MKYFSLAFVLMVFLGTSFAGDLKYVTSGNPNFAGQKWGSITDAAQAVATSQSLTLGAVTSSGCSVSAQSQGRVCDTSFRATNAYSVYSITVSSHYCSDSAPKWDGNICKLPDPCERFSGQFHNGGAYGSVRLPGGDAGSDRNYYSGTGDSIPGSMCIDGCQADANPTKDFGVMAGNQWSIAANPKFNGASCGSGSGLQPSSKVQKNTPEYDCVKVGKAFGYVNGSVLCTDSANKEGANTKISTTTNADGTKTIVEKNTVMSCTGAGSCTTTTTTTTTVINSSGQTVGTPTTTTDSVQSGVGTGSAGGASGSPFCSENPTSPMCKSGSFVGSCDAQPACEGDPVQCAVAIATWKTDCKTLPPGTPVDEQPPITEKKIENTFSYSDLGGGSSSCPSPQHISIGGQSIPIEYTALCLFAAGIRPIVILLAWIGAAYIVFARPKNA